MKKGHLGFMSSLLGALFLFGALLSSSPAWALDGQEILEKVEQVMNAPKDRSATIKMVIKDKDGNVKEREMKVLQKGEMQRLFTFAAPAEVRGVSFLVTKKDQTYLYTPAFGKIRRIASSAKSENFMGTDFSYNDLSKGDYPNKYTATLDKEDAENYYLTCIPKPGSDSDYSKAIMVVQKASFMAVKISMYDKSGKLFKILETPKVEKIDGYWSTRKMTMTDVQNNHVTEMVMDKIEHDLGLSDREFSKRKLKKFH